MSTEAQTSKPKCGCRHDALCPACVARLSHLAELCAPPVLLRAIIHDFDTLHVIAANIGYKRPMADRGCPGPLGPAHRKLARDILGTLSVAEHLDSINTMAVFPLKGILGYGPSEEGARSLCLRSGQVAVRRLQEGDPDLVEQALKSGEFGIGLLGDIELQRLRDVPGATESESVVTDLKKCIHLMERYYTSASREVVQMRVVTAQLHFDVSAMEELQEIIGEHCSTIAKLLETLALIYREGLPWLTIDERRKMEYECCQRIYTLGDADARWIAQALHNAACLVKKQGH
ncbi:hypothetical protein DFJ74DRAFT_667614 [Hyaloraphidium curvatum]|nr:hypothetical protein DFJ74DRAFT_667614 [Hyaloraphidium curvatum]